VFGSASIGNVWDPTIQVSLQLRFDLACIIPGPVNEISDLVGGIVRAGQVDGE
jgi:hypothetical protein